MPTNTARETQTICVASIITCYPLNYIKHVEIIRVTFGKITLTVYIYPCISQTHVRVNPPFQGQRLDFSSFLVKEKFRLIESFQVFDLLFLRMYWKHSELKKNCSVKFRNTCLYHHNSWFKHIWALPFTGEVIYHILLITLKMKSSCI